jgi:hypothetical protein
LLRHFCTDFPADSKTIFGPYAVGGVVAAGFPGPCRSRQPAPAHRPNRLEIDLIILEYNRT